MSESEWIVHCKILGVSENCSLNELKDAYRENAKLLHPDKHQNSALAKQKFQQLQQSYEYLLGHFGERQKTRDTRDSSNSRGGPRTFTNGERPEPGSSQANKPHRLKAVFPTAFVLIMLVGAFYAAISQQIPRSQPSPKIQSAVPLNSETQNTPRATEQKSLNDAAGFCPVVYDSDINSPKAFLLSLIDALDLARSGRKYSVKGGSVEPADSFGYLKQAQQSYACGMKHLSSYLTSKDENIRSSASSVSDVLNGAYAFTGYVVAEIRDALDGRVVNGGQGTNAEKSAEMSNAMSEQWKRLALAAALATYSIIDPAHKGYLTLTESERREVIAAIESRFGKFKKKDLRYIEYSASVLHNFLKNRSWRSATSGANDLAWRPGS